MTTKERILTFIKEMNIKQTDFFMQIEVAPSNFKGSAKKSELGSDKIVKILSLYPDLSPDWLLLGTGDMLRNNKERANLSIKTVENMTGNIGHDNHMVNISMPESGTQKIIRPSGEIEIQRETPAIKDDDSKLVEARKEIEQLRQTVELLKDNIKDKNDLIASLKDTIELLRHKQ